MRNALADAYMRCLPRVERKLVFGPEKALSQQPVTLTEGMYAVSQTFQTLYVISSKLFILVLTVTEW